MNELVIHSLYLLAGIVAYASVHHFVYALSPPRNQMQMLFAGVCVLATLFTLLLAGTFQATSIIEFVSLLKWNIAAVILLLILFSWFIARYTGIQPRIFLVGLTALFVVLFVVNLIQPYSLQYDYVEGLRTLYLPWGETVTRANGHSGSWIYVGATGVIILFGYALYALGVTYYRYRRRTDWWMLFAVGLFFLGAINGILTRISAIDFIELGPFSLIAMVLVMGSALTSEMQQRLRNSERDFRSLFENSPTALVAIDPNSHRIVQANRIAVKLTGYSAEEILTTTVTDQTHTDDLANTNNYYKQLSNGLVDHVYYEKRYRRKDGGTFIGYTSISTIKDDDGKIIRLIGSTVDITERKRTESALRESEEKLQAVMKASEVAIAWADESGRIEYINPKFISIFGYTLDDVPTVEQWYLHAYPDAHYRAKVVDEWNAKMANSVMARTAIGTMEVNITCKDGSTRYVLLMGSWAGTRLLVNFNDITERKLAEEALLKTNERLELAQKLRGVAFGSGT